MCSWFPQIIYNTSISILSGLQLHSKRLFLWEVRNLGVCFVHKFYWFFSFIMHIMYYVDCLWSTGITVIIIVKLVDFLFWGYFPTHNKSTNNQWNVHQAMSGVCVLHCPFFSVVECSDRATLYHQYRVWCQVWKVAVMLSMYQYNIHVHTPPSAHV